MFGRESAEAAQGRKHTGLLFGADLLIHRAAWCRETAGVGRRIGQGPGEEPQDRCLICRFRSLAKPRLLLFPCLSIPSCSRKDPKGLLLCMVKVVGTGADPFCSTKLQWATLFKLSSSFEKEKIKTWT